MDAIGTLALTPLSPAVRINCVRRMSVDALNIFAIIPEFLQFALPWLPDIAVFVQQIPELCTLL